MPRFRAVILDADSTLSGLEGIDWLAGQRGPEVAQASEAATRRAMDGTVPLEAVYAQRLAMIRPTRAEMATLADVYVRAMAEGAVECVRALHAAQVRVVIVSGGLREALLPMAAVLGVSGADVHAVSVRYDASGAIEALDGVQLLAMSGGKPTVVRALALPAPVLAVGDGMTDADIRPVVAAFAAFTGFVKRDAVVAAADHVLDSFDALARLVLA